MAPVTNLAQRPFRNERLPWLFAALLLFVAVIVSALHARFLTRLGSGDEANTVRLVRENEERIVELEELVGKEPPLRLETAELARLRAFKDLVDRRVFPWRRLLLELETALASDVRLSRISPEGPGKNRGMVIGMSGVARSKDAAFAFAEALDTSPAFSNAVIRSLSEDGSDTQFQLEVEFNSLGASSGTGKGTETP